MRAAERRREIIYQTLVASGGLTMSAADISRKLGGVVTPAVVGQHLGTLAAAGYVEKIDLGGMNSTALWYVPDAESHILPDVTGSKILNIAASLVAEKRYFSLEDVYAGIGISPDSEAWHFRTSVISTGRLSDLLVENGYAVDSRVMGRRKAKFTRADLIPPEFRSQTLRHTKNQKGRNQYTSNETLLRRLRERMLEEPEFIMQVREAVADVEKEVMGVLSYPGAHACRVLEGGVIQ